jgi:hypothetical protein
MVDIVSFFSEKQSYRAVRLQREEHKMFEEYIGNEVGKIRVEEAERNAARNWRFRDIKTPQAKAVNALLTSIVSFLVR